MLHIMFGFISYISTIHSVIERKRMPQELSGAITSSTSWQSVIIPELFWSFYRFMGAKDAHAISRGVGQNPKRLHAQASELSIWLKQTEHLPYH